MTLRENIRRGIAVGSAGTLGYIAGGIPAAVFYGSVANKFLPKSKKTMIGVKRKASKTLRRSTKKTKVAAKRRYKSVKKVRKTKCRKLSRCTSKKVRDIVNKVLSKKDPTGTYIKNLGYAALKPPLTPLLTNQQIVSDQIYNATGGSTYFLNFFQPQSFIDAASILFNGKTAALGIGGVGDFTDPELKFLVQYASVKVTFTNYCQQRIKLRLYEVTPKNIEYDSFINEYKDSLEATNLNQTGGTVATIFDIGMKPTLISNLKKRYKIVTKTFLLDAGDIVSHFIKLSDFKFNRSDYMDANSLATFSSTSKQLMYAYEPVMGAGISNTGTFCTVGRAYPASAPANGPTNMGLITVEVNEKFIIDAPPSTSVANSKDNLATFQGYQTDTTSTSVYALRNDRIGTMQMYQRQ